LYEAKETQNTRKRFGNTTKQKLSNFLDQICKLIIVNQITLDKASCETFVFTILQCYDIHWLLNHVLLWSNSSYIAPIYEAIKSFDWKTFEAQMSRDNLLFLKQIQANKYTPESAVIALIKEPGNGVRDQLQQLETLCNFKFNKQIYMQYAFLSKNTFTTCFLEDRGLKPANLYNFEDILADYDAEQLELHICAKSYATVLKDAYKICAENGWVEQALWVFKYQHFAIQDKHRAFIDSEALSIAYNKQQFYFIEQKLTSQKLFENLEWLKSTKLIQDTTEPDRHIPDWWQEFLYLYITNSYSDMYLKKIINDRKTWMLPLVDKVVSHIFNSENCNVEQFMKMIYHIQWCFAICYTNAGSCFTIIDMMPLTFANLKESPEYTYLFSEICNNHPEACKQIKSFCSLLFSVMQYQLGIIDKILR